VDADEEMLKLREKDVIKNTHEFFTAKVFYGLTV